MCLCLVVAVSAKLWPLRPREGNRVVGDPIGGEDGTRVGCSVGGPVGGDDGTRDGGAGGDPVGGTMGPSDHSLSLLDTGLLYMTLSHTLLNSPTFWLNDPSLHLPVPCISTITI